MHHTQLDGGANQRRRPTTRFKGEQLTLRLENKEGRSPKKRTALLMKSIKFLRSQSDSGGLLGQRTIKKPNLLIHLQVSCCARSLSASLPIG